MLPVALLGFIMLARWIPVYRVRASTAAGADGAPAERAIPLPAVLGHGVLAVPTLVLVLLTTLGVGES